MSDADIRCTHTHNVLAEVLLGWAACPTRPRRQEGDKSVRVCNHGSRQGSVEFVCRAATSRMAFDLPGLLGCQRADQTIYITHRKLAEKKLRPFGIGGMKTNASFLPFCRRRAGMM